MALIKRVFAAILLTVLATTGVMADSAGSSAMGTSTLTYPGYVRLRSADPLFSWLFLLTFSKTRLDEK